MEEVEELLHFCTQPIRNLSAKENVSNERQDVGGGMILTPHPPHVLEENGNMYTPITAHEKNVCHHRRCT